jgi:hypothetical protein
VLGPFIGAMVMVGLVVAHAEMAAPGLGKLSVALDVGTWFVAVLVTRWVAQSGGDA